MPNPTEIIFEERQSIGSNKQSLALRIFLALFCFVAYFYSDEPDSSTELLFILGIAILFISALLLFVTHIRYRLTRETLTIQGMFSTGKVVVPIDSITNAEKVKYSSYIINTPVYNLHRHGVISFYSGGRFAIKITTNHGGVYILGTDRPDSLLRCVLDAAHIS